MQTNQLDESSQNQEIFIKSLEDYECIKNNTEYTYFCNNCGKQCKAKKRNSKVSQRLFLCMSCLTKKTNLEKYGVENTFQLQKVIEMTKNRDWTERNEKTKQTWLEKYGVDSPMKLESTVEKLKETFRNKTDEQKKLIVNKCKKTMLERYGVDNPMKSQYFKEKVAKTNIEKYGCPCPLNNETIKHKIEETNQKKYGCKEPFSSKEVRDKIKKTCIKKYGVDNICKDKSFREKVKNTMIEKYGVESNLMLKEFQVKCRKTLKERYNVEHPFQSEEIMNKMKQTCLNKYGVEYYCQTEDFSLNHRKIYYFDNVKFDSFWELVFYLFHKSNGSKIERSLKKFEYVYNGKTHYYFPDFEVDGKLYEIKGDHFFDENGKMINPYDRSQDGFFEAKYQCGLRNGVVFIRQKEIDEMSQTLICINNDKNFLIKLKEASRIERTIND